MRSFAFCLVTCATLGVAVGAEPASPGSAHARVEPASRDFAIRAGQVLPAADGFAAAIADAWIVVRDGRIVALGPDVPVPDDVPTFLMPWATIVPGFVAAATDLAGEHTDSESTGAGFRALDGFDRFADWRPLLASGVTTVHLSPGRHRLIPGQGAVIKLAGRSEDRVLRPDGELCVVLGEPAWGPPLDARLTVPTSSDQEIVPGQPQRPDSRLGQLLALRESVAAALRGEHPDRLLLHSESLANLWRNSAPVRIDADRAADLLAGMSFLRAQERHGYLVGGIESHRVADSLRRARVPIVIRPRVHFGVRGPAADLGASPDALESDLEDLLQLTGVDWVLGPPAGQSPGELRMVAVSARGLGIRHDQVLRAITSGPARILGIADRVGSLSPGRDADFVVLSGDPLAVSSHVERVYVSGELAFEATPRAATVIRAGTVWLDAERQLRPGAILIEEGVVVAVGHSVPEPIGARIIDAGDDAFACPGLIDAHSHLGFEGDRGAAPTALDPSRLFGATSDADLRVARAGVTTVLTTSYAFAPSGSRISAVKTHGAARDERLVSATAALAIDFSDQDPAGIAETLDARLAPARRYAEAWQKYEKQLEAWRAGEKPAETGVTTEVQNDPVSGVWEGSASGGPLESPYTGKLTLQLRGTSVEGRVLEPRIDIPHKILLTLTGESLRGTIEVEFPGLLGVPTVEARLTEPDTMKGTVGVMGFTVDFEARRTSKTPVETRVTRASRGADGRPLPPSVDDNLEPLRAVLAKQLPLLVRVETPAQISAVLDHAVEKLELGVVLLDAAGAHQLTERLQKLGVGVVLPHELRTRKPGSNLLVGDLLQRAGVRVALQSGAEDGARDLPKLALHAVARGMAADRALSALTLEAAKLFRIDQRVGSLTVGKDGDVVIFQGHPFLTGGRVLRVFVRGQEVVR